MRNETRRQRYDRKANQAIKLPVSLVTVNFDFDDNLAFVIRTAACFGISSVCVIGSIPSRSFLNPKSGSLYDYVKLISFKNPSMFLLHARQNNWQLVAAEISDEAKNIYNYQFNFTKHTAIILGHETTGIPTEIAYASTHVFIPMPGSGFSLNTSQTGTAFITEYSRQFFRATE